MNSVTVVRRGKMSFGKEGLRAKERNREPEKKGMAWRDSKKNRGEHFPTTLEYLVWEKDKESHAQNCFTSNPILKSDGNGHHYKTSPKACRCKGENLVRKRLNKREEGSQRRAKIGSRERSRMGESNDNGKFRGAVKSENTSTRKKVRYKRKITKRKEMTTALQGRASVSKCKRLRDEKQGRGSKNKIGE